MSSAHISTGATGGAYHGEGSSESKSPTPDYYTFQYRGHKIDVYRLCEIAGIRGGPQEHAFKKIIRAGKKPGESIEKEIDGAISALLRWKEMLKEDKS